MGSTNSQSDSLHTGKYWIFFQQVVQDAQGLEGEVLHYHVIGLNESSTEDYLEKPIVNWLFNITLKKKKASTGFCCFSNDK